MTPRGTATVAAGSISAVVGLVLGLVILGGGGDSVANAASAGLRAATVPAEYEQWVLKAGTLCPGTVGPAVIAAQIDAESNWNPRAVSRAGAQGLAQFMPGTWPTWSQDDDGTGQVSPFDAGDAIMAQSRYMCALAEQMRHSLRAGQVQGDLLDLALAAYNAGPLAVIAAGGVPRNGETDLYVAKIRQYMARYSAPVLTGTGGPFGTQVITAAQTQLDKPYVWGGGDAGGPTGGGFDCSGLVLFAVYQASGGRISLPHLADAQARLGQPVTGPAPGASIDLSLLRPGDIIAFADPGASTFHHIGIYVGNGQLLHAPDTGDVVKLAPLATSYWANQTWQVRRFG